MNPLIYVALGAGILAVAALATIFAISLFNELVALRNDLQKAWSNIEVLLQRRHDELPALAEACRQAMSQEGQVLESVIRLRTGFDQAPTSNGKTDAENQLNRELIGVWERYPALKADANVQKLLRRISDLEETIADRRKFFNDTAEIYNTRLEKFPERFFAGTLGFSRHAYLETADAERRSPEMGKVSS